MQFSAYMLDVITDSIYPARISVEDGFFKEILPIVINDDSELDIQGIILPGFIDSHIHFSQSEIQGMYGKQLLDWLDEYTFPAEEAFSSMEYAQDIARFFVKELVKNGTTTCAAYATVHPASVTALFSVATEYNMCILAGKVMMNRNAPDYLMDTTHQGELDCRSLIEDWDGKGRNHYVITPRFAITSTPDQLKSAGRLHAEYPSTYIPTHLSANLGENEVFVTPLPLVS